MNQKTYDASGAGVSQCQKILDRLLAANGEIVCTHELTAISGSYVVHRRIHDLRKRGHNIITRRGRGLVGYSLSTNPPIPQEVL